MEQIETFLTDPRFVTGGPLSLLDILPFAVLLALLILSIAGFFRHQTRLGQTSPPKSAFEKLKFLGAAMVINPLGQFTLFSLATAYLVLFLLALVATFVLLATVIGWIDGPDEMEQARSSLGLGALLVALLGAPFLVWRSVVAQMTLTATQKQTALQDEALFNDKINAAATDLAARREVTKIVEQDGKVVVLTEWQDDLVTRAAAIDRLEGLAKEALDRGDIPRAQRIARMLSIYVQEFSEVHKAQPSQDFESRDQTMAWASTLRARRRTDVERAVVSLGRIKPIDPEISERFRQNSVDLSHSNLQGFNLRGLDYSGANFEGARLDGADLAEANLHGTTLNGATFDGAVLWESQLKGASMREIRIQAADLFKASLESCNLEGARAEGAILDQATMNGADLRLVRMSKETDLAGADFSGAAISETNNETVSVLQPFLTALFADGSILPNHPERPGHWCNNVLDGGMFVQTPPPLRHRLARLGRRTPPRRPHRRRLAPLTPSA